MCDHNNVPMTAPEFYRDFDCLEDDSVSKSRLPPRSLRWWVDVK